MARVVESINLIWRRPGCRSYFVGTINRVGIEEHGDNDSYVESYYCDPKGQLIGALGSA